ncbi:GNAT family N-acetyltransferase [Chitinimonas viridis]|uniref:GNAT family N-acetyltransferase n=1 Tax=Chitinimonas viridis TaxID=664880 RepID=A0ABT8B0U6_9NEIS|nr:GNAT family N-acetyltransferase [Chitinimonas viridis]MDN3575859.1 GNAT family N-acetyltransferase [Chitinimonas viridis]
MQTAAIQVRPATLADWPTLKALRLAALLDAPKAFGISHAQVANDSDEQWQARAGAQAGPTFFLAYAHEQAIGLVGGVVHPQSQAYHLIAMWVAPAARGSTAASSLVQAVINHASQLGHSRVVLSVSPTNERACQLYQRMGFSFTEQTETLASHPEITVQVMVREY